MMSTPEGYYVIVRDEEDFDRYVDDGEEGVDG